MFKLVYWIVSAGSIGLLVVEAPSGSLLSSTPERGKVEISKPEKGQAGPTVRRGPTFVWLGGGYHGGK